jgi:O-methyltransferase involved in polyketide biosynthesis
MSPASAAISPTAHYTAYVWSRNGRLASRGRDDGRSCPVRIPAPRDRGWPAVRWGRRSSPICSRVTGRSTRCYCAIEQAEISQVVEVACGLSPRGWRFVQRFGERLPYLEADLPDMAARKRTALERMGSLSERHRVVALGALAESGAESLDALAAGLDPGAGVAVATEGLLGYLDGDSVSGLWRRIASLLSGFPAGRYISDLHIGAMRNAQVRVFRVLLSAFVRGRVHLHFDTCPDAEAAVRAAGFTSAVVRPGASIVPLYRDPGSGMVHILEASSR